MSDPKRPSLHFGGIEFGVSSSAPAPRQVSPGTPFRILVVGDFSGRGAAPHNSVHRPVQVDRDNFDDILAQIAPRLDNVVLRSNGTPETITFRDMEDFEPDRLYESLSLFEKLRTVRRRLLNNSTFASAAAEVRMWLDQSEPAAPTVPAPPRPGEIVEGVPVDTTELLEQALDVTQQEFNVSSGSIDVERMVREIIRPHLEEKPDPKQGELVATVDAMQAQLMRTVLHHPSFQRLEALWRSLLLLVRRLETDSQLQVFILDFSEPAMMEDLTKAGDLRHSQLYKTIVEATVGTQGGIPWSVIATDVEIEPTEGDALLAGCLSSIGARAGAPVLASATTTMFGSSNLWKSQEPDDWTFVPCRDTQSLWTQIRQRPDAAYLGLVSPRFLVRRPYDEGSSRIESIEFEEVVDGEHRDYLWASGALLVAYLLGRTYAADGAAMRAGTLNEVENLPTFHYQDDGETVMLPVAEVLLHQRAMDKIAEAGIMPLASVKNQDRVRVMSFRSIAADGRSIAGRWN